jgi:MFS transporter, DHA1 family, inner membrane transport protein
MIRPAKESRSSLPILLLSAAGFTILTTEFVIVGLLPSMAKDLKVSVSQAGLLVTLFAFTVAVAGPLLTASLVNRARKRLFVFVLLLFSLSNALAAAAPNIGVMALARFIPALMLPVFWSLASETAVQITGPERAGKAISMISFGVVTATIFGIPTGTLISDKFGWRSAFAVLSALALAKAFLLLAFLPKIHGNKERISVWRQLGILGDPRILGHVLLSLLVFAGMFTAYTYLTDMLERLAGFDGSMVGWILMGFGGVGLVGNWLGGRIVDRNPLGASILFCISIAGVLIVLVPFIKSAAGLFLVLTIWGISQAALFTVSHTRVMNAAESTPALGASLNISGANLGIALGAIVGGRMIDLFGLASVGTAAAAIVAVAIAAAAFLMVTESPKTQTCEECGSPTE